MNTHCTYPNCRCKTLTSGPVCEREPTLALPVQAEPKRYLYQWADGHESLDHGFRNGAYPAKVTPLYTAPPARDPAWVEEAMRLHRLCEDAYLTYSKDNLHESLKRYTKAVTALRKHLETA